MSSVFAVDRARRCVAAALVGCAVTSGSLPVAAGTLQILTDSSVPGVRSYAYAINADGTTIVGKVESAVQPPFRRGAYSWASDGTPTPLGTAQVPFPWGSVGEASATGVSGDGLITVGWQENGISFEPEAFSQTSSGRTTLAGVEAGGTEARGISSDGTVIVGYSGSQAVTWSGGSVTALSTLSGYSVGRANAVSADGTVVVGVNGGSGLNAPVRWTAGTPLHLGTLGGAGEAKAVSADGAVVTGFGLEGTGPNVYNKGWRWTSGTGMTKLTTLGGADTLGGDFALPAAISADGSTIVGQSTTSGGSSNQVAFLWTASLGMVNLQTYLTLLGEDLTGWTLTNANAISADGRWVTGFGSFNGVETAYVVSVSPVPEIDPAGMGSVMALVCGALGLVERRRRSRA